MGSMRCEPVLAPLPHALARAAAAALAGLALAGCSTDPETLPRPDGSTTARADAGADAEADAGAGPDGGASADATTPADAGAVPSGPVSGRRLQGHWVESLDGQQRRFLGIFDANPRQPCILNHDPRDPAVLRCQPRDYGYVVYLDATCTTPYLEMGGVPHLWASTPSGPVRVGDAVQPPPAQRWLSFAPGQCALMPAPPDAPVYAIAEELGDDALVRGPLERADESDTLASTTFVGDDGSRFLFALHDRISGAVCTPERGPVTRCGPPARCAPYHDGTVEDEGLLDPQCERLAVTPYGTSRVASVVGRGGDVYRFEVVDRTDATVGRRAADGTCTVEPIELGRRTLHFGVPYPSTEWPGLFMPRTAPGLAAAVPLLPSGRRAEPASLRASDFELDGAPCRPLWMGGALRCAPINPAHVQRSEDLYTDARCSQPAIAVDPGTTPPAVVVVTESTNQDTAGLEEGHVWEVGAPTGRAGYRGSPGVACAQDPTPATVHARGALVPAASMPELRLRIE